MLILLIKIRYLLTIVNRLSSNKSGNRENSSPFEISNVIVICWFCLRTITTSWYWNLLHLATNTPHKATEPFLLEWYLYRSTLLGIPLLLRCRGRIQNNKLIASTLLQICRRNVFHIGGWPFHFLCYYPVLPLLL